MNIGRILTINRRWFAYGLVIALLAWTGVAWTASGPEWKLIEAAGRGDVAEVKSLLAKGPNVNEMNRCERTALTEAARTGNVEIVRLLLDKGADPNAVNSYGWTALTEAASANQLKTTRLLLDRGADIDGEDEYGRTSLMRSVEMGHTEMANLLLDKGADVNAKEVDGWTAIRTAAKRRDINMVKLLLAHGAENTIAMAAMLGDTKEIGRLLDSGEDINEKDQVGRTPLMVASEMGNTDVVRVLLEKGADVNAGDIYGGTALTEAVANKNPDLVRMLLDKGADVNAKRKIGWTALTLAVRTKQPDLVKMLLDRGADPNLGRNKYHMTALMEAVKSGQEDVVKMLLDRGADVNAEAEEHLTALNFLPSDDGEIAQILKAHGGKRHSGITLHFSLHRDDVRGGVFRPRCPNQAIRLDSQEVTIRLGDTKYIVDAVLRFFNTAEATTIWIGLKRTWENASDFSRFDAWVDSEKAELSEHTGRGIDAGSTCDKSTKPARWLGLNVQFQGHRVTTIRVSYEADYPGLPLSYGSRKNHGYASYLFGTKSHWKNSMGKTTFTIDGTPIGGRKGFWTDENNRVVSFCHEVVTENVERYEVMDYGQWSSAGEFTVFLK